MVGLFCGAMHLLERQQIWKTETSHIFFQFICEALWKKQCAKGKSNCAWRDIWKIKPPLECHFLYGRQIEVRF